MSDSVGSSNYNDASSSDNNNESNDDNNSNIMPSDEDEDNFEYESTSDYNYEEDEEQEEQNNTSLYNQHPVSCPICCDDKIEEGCAVILPNCSHSFCVECFTAYVGKCR